MLTEAICVQVVPLDDRDAVKVLPLRTNRTQYGAEPLEAVCVLVPPVETLL